MANTVYALFVRLVGKNHERVVFMTEHIELAEKSFVALYQQLEQAGGTPWSKPVVAERNLDEPCFGKVLMHLIVDFPHSTVQLMLEAWTLNQLDEWHWNWMLNEATI